MRSSETSGLSALAAVTIVLITVCLVALLMSSLGCAHQEKQPSIPLPTPTPPPVEVWTCPEPDTLPPLVLPAIRPFPTGGAPSVLFQAIREWLADFRDAVVAREGVMKDRIEAQERMLDQYRQE